MTDTLHDHEPGAPSGVGRSLTLGDFDYEFPEHLVAQEPCAERDGARLLVRAANGAVRHAHVTDLTSELPEGTLLILNESRVFPSRLFAHLPTGGRVELFLLERLDAGNEGKSSAWRALGRPMRKLRVGTEIQLDAGLKARVTSKSEEADGVTATIDLAFNLDEAAFTAWLEGHGYIPLPPYIKRTQAEPASSSPDRDRYQTVYARETGSVAAPTAGLHISPNLLEALAAKSVEIKKVCLHVGGGTFLPVKSEDLGQHRMHSERSFVPLDTMEAILRARREGRKVVAVGTTTLRTLEDVSKRANRDPERFLACSGQWNSTDIFIYPRHQGDRHKSLMIDALMTNFHQPKSTLFMLVSSLLGLTEAKKLYATAIAESYRLYSYGDASLLWL